MLTAKVAVLHDDSDQTKCHLIYRVFYTYAGTTEEVQISNDSSEPIYFSMEEAPQEITIDIDAVKLLGHSSIEFRSEAELEINGTVIEEKETTLNLNECTYEQVESNDEALVFDDDL